MIVNYQVVDCFNLLDRIVKEFHALDLEDKWRDETIPRKLWKLKRHGEIMQDFPLMYLDEETARRLRNKQLTERMTYYEQSLSRAQYLTASQGI